MKTKKELQTEIGKRIKELRESTKAIINDALPKICESPNQVCQKLTLTNIMANKAKNKSVAFNLIVLFFF